jgi:hypothetical protein
MLEVDEFDTDEVLLIEETLTVCDEVFEVLAVDVNVDTDVAAELEAEVETSLELVKGVVDVLFWPRAK